MKRRSFMKGIAAVVGFPLVSRAVSGLPESPVDHAMDADPSEEIIPASRHPELERKLSKIAEQTWERGSLAESVYVHPVDVERMFGGPCDLYGFRVFHYVSDFGEIRILPSPHVSLGNPEVGYHDPRLRLR